VIRERDRGAVYLSRIEQLASTDSLTGLMNRRRFEDRFEAALLSARMQHRVSERPDDAEDFGPLFHVAELRMYDLKHPAASPR
jgi:GGDEF domain-containing protein